MAQHGTSRTLILGLSSVVATFSVWAQPVNFTDNFSPPSSLWNSLTGNWTASAGDYYAQNPNNSPFALTVLPLDLSNYSLTVQVNNLADSGILVRSNGSSNYVLLVLGGLGYGQGIRSSVAGTGIYWADSSNPNATTNLVTNVFTPGGTYSITVTAVGDTFSAYINGASTPVTTITDAAGGASGMVGLYDDQPNTTHGGSGTPTSYSKFSLSGTEVPLPSSAWLLLGALSGLGMISRRRTGHSVA